MVIIDLINHGSELAVKRARCFLFFFGFAARDKISSVQFSSVHVYLGNPE